MESLSVDEQGATGRTPHGVRESPRMEAPWCSASTTAAKLLWWTLPLPRPSPHAWNPGREAVDPPLAIDHAVVEHGGRRTCWCTLPSSPSNGFAGADDRSKTHRSNQEAQRAKRPGRKCCHAGAQFDGAMGRTSRLASLGPRRRLTTPGPCRRSVTLGTALAIGGRRSGAVAARRLQGCDPGWQRRHHRSHQGSAGSHCQQSMRRLHLRRQATGTQWVTLGKRRRRDALLRRSQCSQPP